MYCSIRFYEFAEDSSQSAGTEPHIKVEVHSLFAKWKTWSFYFFPKLVESNEVPYRTQPSLDSSHLEYDLLPRLEYVCEKLRVTCLYSATQIALEKTPKPVRRGEVG